jgi:uncharacterized membrane protein
MSLLPELLIIPALLGSALMAGLFFIFSNTVMTSLSKLPEAEGIRAMQAINRDILNPLFLGSFLGTAVLSLVIGILALTGWGPLASHWFLSAACLYLFGTFFYTMARNVPLNEKLEHVSADEAAEFWQVYLKRWTRYNHNRTVASILAVIFYAIGLTHL